MKKSMAPLAALTALLLRFSLTACRCIGACGLAPVMTIN